MQFKISKHLTLYRFQYNINYGSKESIRFSKTIKTGRKRALCVITKHPGREYKNKCGAGKSNTACAARRKCNLLHCRVGQNSIPGEKYVFFEIFQKIQKIHTARNAAKSRFVITHQCLCLKFSGMNVPFYSYFFCHWCHLFRR